MECLTFLTSGVDRRIRGSDERQLRTRDSCPGILFRFLNDEICLSTFGFRKLGFRESREWAGKTLWMIWLTNFLWTGIHRLISCEENSVSGSKITDCLYPIFRYYNSHKEILYRLERAASFWEIEVLIEGMGVLHIFATAAKGTKSYPSSNFPTLSLVYRQAKSACVHASGFSRKQRFYASLWKFITLNVLSSLT